MQKTLRKKWRQLCCVEDIASELQRRLAKSLFIIDWLVWFLACRKSTAYHRHSEILFKWETDANRVSSFVFCFSRHSSSARSGWRKEGPTTRKHLISLGKPVAENVRKKKRRKRNDAKNALSARSLLCFGTLRYLINISISIRNVLQPAKIKVSHTV